MAPQCAEQFLQGTPVALPHHDNVSCDSIGQGRVLMRGEGGDSGKGLRCVERVTMESR